MPKQSTEFSTQINTIRKALMDKRYQIAEQQAIQYVKKDSLSAQGWLLLGEALMHQKYGNAARVAFKRAALLDPQAPWIQEIEPLLEKLPDGVERLDILELLKVKSVRVTAAIMTNNEERTIARCIRSLLDAVDEIVVIDSGSTDRTLDIVRQFPQVRIVTNIPLDDNFAAKRNRGLEHLTGDWVIWVDADEWLEPEDVAHVREVAGLFHDVSKPVLLQISQLNHVEGEVHTEYSIPRMFTLRRGLRYKGRVHEQVVSEEGQQIDRWQIRIRLHHDGYEPDVVKRKNKIARNIRLLKKMIEEEPDQPVWWLLYGRETLLNGQLDEALHILTKTEQLIDRHGQFDRTPELYRWMIHIFIQKQAFDLAENVCLRALNRHPNFPDFYYWLSRIRIHKATVMLKQAEEGLIRAKKAFHTYRGSVSPDRTIFDWKADIALAELVRMSGKPEQAEEMVREITGKYPAAAHFKKQNRANKDGWKG